MAKVLITALGLQLLLDNENYKTGDFHQALLDIAYRNWNEHDDSIVYAARDYDTKQVLFRGTHAEISGWRQRLIDSGKEHEARNVRIDKDDTREAWSYGDMLEDAREKFGELFYVLTMAGKYNQQVGNGGHIQYFDNGYADGEGGFGSDHNPSNPLHREMVKLIETEILPRACGEEVEPIQKALDIMKRFRVRVDLDRYHTESCEACGGSGNVEDGDGEEERCGECDGSGEVEVENDERGSVTNRDELDRLDSAWYEIDDDVMKAINSFACRAMNSAGAETAPAIARAALAFEDHFKMSQDNREYVIPPCEFEHDPHGAASNCYQKLIDEKLEYKYLEEIHFDVGGEIVTGYRRNRAKDADNDLYKRVNEMKVGDVIRYWDDIADVYDEDDEQGNLRHDIREAYDDELDRLVGYGTLEPLIEKDDNGNDITWGYRKVKK